MTASYELPPEVAATIDRFRVAELSTQAKDGTPITVPICVLRRGDGLLEMTTSIGLNAKAFNIRRNPKVSLFFSEPTGSGLTDPPFVLVQGDAVAPDEVHSGGGPLEAAYLTISRRQPQGAMMSSWLMRRWTDWYFHRLILTVTPRRIRWWPRGDLTATPTEVEVRHDG